MTIPAAPWVRLQVMFSASPIDCTVDTLRRDCTLAVLAGGAGTRMGRPKGDLSIRGRPILRYLLDQWVWPGPTMLVTAPDSALPQGGEGFTRVAADPVSGQGPLRGLLTALESAETEFLLVVTVDMPGLRRVHLDYLVQAFAGHPASAGLMFRRTGLGERQIEPFPLMARRAVLYAIVQNAYRSGKRSVRGLSESDLLVLTDSPADWPETAWTNLNRPADLHLFETIAAKEDQTIP